MPPRDLAATTVAHATDIIHWTLPSHEIIKDWAHVGDLRDDFDTENETEDEMYEDRVAALAGPTTRAVSWSSLRSTFAIHYRPFSRATIDRLFGRP